MTGAVVWFTGLPASGKSTLARAVAARLREARREPVVLDGDDVRAALVPSPGHDPSARDGFYRTLGGLAGMLAQDGLIVLVAATAHQRAWRAHARGLAPRFVEVYLATPLGECRRRDHDLGLLRRLVRHRGARQPGRRRRVQALGVAPGGDARAIDAILAHLAIGGIDP